MQANDNTGKSYDQIVAEHLANCKQIQAVIDSPNPDYTEEFRERGRQMIRDSREFLEELRKQYAPNDPSFIIREV